MMQFSRSASTEEAAEARGLVLSIKRVEGGIKALEAAILAAKTRWPGRPTQIIESRAENAGVVLVRRGVAPVQPQRWPSIRAVVASSPSLREAIGDL